MIKYPNLNSINKALGGGSIYGSSAKPKRQPIAQSTKRAVEIRQNGKCALCHKPLVGSKHFDHIKPVSKKGKSTTENLRALCASCHDKRHILERAAKMDKKKSKRVNKNPLYNFKY